MRKKLVVISGMAGAGKSSAARAFEDMGFFVVDNLPPQLINTLIQLSDSSGDELRKIALVCDARETTFLKAFEPIWNQLRQTSHETNLLFLDCSDDILLQRFKETRRRHPLDQGEGLKDAIAREREHLKTIQGHADEVIDTQDLSVHDLKRRIKDHFGSPVDSHMRVSFMSFGFKYGLPRNLDLCFDVRFLTNPFFVPELRPLSGLSEEVSSYVRSAPEARTFEEHLGKMLRFLVPQYEREGKSYLTVAIGCTGGRHRSVALCEALAKKFGNEGQIVHVEHRDIDKFTP